MHIVKIYFVVCINNMIWDILVHCELLFN